MALNFPDSSIEQTYIAPNGTTYIWNGSSWVVTPVLPVSRGGTGFTTYAHGDILYGDSSKQLNKLTAGTSGYVLSTNGSGADPSWIPMSTGGGAGTVATPGAQYQIAGYYSGSGASVSGSTTLTNDINAGIVYVTHATGSTSTFTGALLVFGGLGVSGQIFTSTLQTTGNAIIAGTLTARISNTFGTTPASHTVTFNSRVASDFIPSTDNSRDLGNSSLGWRNFKVSGIGTVVNLKVSTSADVSSTTTSIGFSSGALVVSGGVGIGGSLNVADVSKFFQHLEIKTEKELRLFNAADTQYVAIKAGTISVSTTYTLPTGYPGAGSSFLTSDTSGNLAWGVVTAGVSAVNAGAGISIPSSSGSVTVSIGRPVVLNLASGFTPVGIGTDYNIIRVPEGKSNTNTNYNIKKVVMGVGTTSLGTSTIRIEKSTGPHTGLVGFSNSSTASTFNVLTTDLSLIGAIGETSWVDFKSGYGTVATGDRIRVNYTSVDSAHANFIIQCLLEEY
jgi:hypothetical protein